MNLLYPQFPCMARENGDFSRRADPVPLRFRAKVKEGRILFPPKASNCLLLRRHGLDNFDLTAIVAAALLAHSVRQVQSTALGACNETGDSQLPGGAASLIASCFGYFSLRYCHCDTSLIIQRPGSVARPYSYFICSPKVWPGRPAADPSPFCRSRGRGSGRRRSGNTVPCNLQNTVFWCPFRG